MNDPWLDTTPLGNHLVLSTTWGESSLKIPVLCLVEMSICPVQAGNLFHSKSSHFIVECVGEPSLKPPVCVLLRCLSGRCRSTASNLIPSGDFHPIFTISGFREVTWQAYFLLPIAPSGAQGTTVIKCIYVFGVTCMGSHNWCEKHK